MPAKCASAFSRVRFLNYHGIFHNRTLFPTGLFEDTTNRARRQIIGWPSGHWHQPFFGWVLELSVTSSDLYALLEYGSTFWLGFFLYVPCLERPGLGISLLIHVLVLWR